MFSSRAASPVVGTAVMVGLVVVVSASVAAVTLNSNGQLSDSPPTAAFETNIDETLVVRHTGGETIAGDRLEVRGGDPIRIPKTIESGDTIEITPDESVEEIHLIWNGDETSVRLASVDAAEFDTDEPTAWPTGVEPPLLDTDSCGEVSGTALFGSCGFVPRSETVTTVNVLDSVDVFLREDAVVENNVVGASGDLVMKGGAEVRRNIIQRTGLYVYEGASVGGSVSQTDTVVLQDGAHIDGTVRSGTDLYLRPGATIGGDVTEFDTVYLQNEEQVGGAIRRTTVVEEYD